MSDSTEYFTAPGPVNEGVLLYVLANSGYAGIRYSFSLPRSKVGELCDPVYYWQVEEWGACEGECGRGERTRAVNCVRLAANKSEEEVVDSFLCDPSSKPVLKESCRTEPCAYHWTAGNWSDCNTTCGDSHQTRTVSCEWRKRNGEKVAVNDTLCGDIATKPDSTQSCTTECVYWWSVSVWSECDVTCGSGRSDEGCGVCVGVEQWEHSCRAGHILY